MSSVLVQAVREKDLGRLESLLKGGWFTTAHNPDERDEQVCVLRVLRVPCACACACVCMHFLFVFLC